MREKEFEVTKEMLYSPPLEEQVARLGGSCEYLWRPHTTNPDLLVYSTSVFRNGNERIVAQRYLQNRNKSISVNWRENPSTTIISASDGQGNNWRTLGEVNLLKRELPLSVEDARIVDYRSDAKLLLATVWPFTDDSREGPNRAVTSQALIVLDEHSQVQSFHYPQRGHNHKHGHYEKNWMPILASSDFSYSLNEQHIVHNFETRRSYRSPGITWKFGEIHGGSQWVRYGSMMFGVFHSSLPINTGSIDGMRHAGRYYSVGLAQATATPPYRIVRFTPQPLLLSSVNNPRVVNGTICLFVSGLTTHCDFFEMGIGINDGASAILQIPIETVQERLCPI